VTHLHAAHSRTLEDEGGFFNRSFMGTVLALDLPESLRVDGCLKRVHALGNTDKLNISISQGRLHAQ
jgi:hypothetical protein